MGHDNGFTPRARYALVIAKEEAHKMNADAIAPHHLLLALLGMEDGVAVDILKKLGINISRLRMEIEKSCKSSGGAPAEAAQEGTPLPFNMEMKQVLISAHEEAREMNYNFIGTEHLLLGILSNGGSDACRVLKNMGVNPENAREEIMRALDSAFMPPPDEKNTDDKGEYLFNGFNQEENPEEGAPQREEDGSFPALSTYGRNMTRLAAEGKLDPVIGRSDEISRVIQILCRRTKNNPCLIGEPGVGKTAVAEGLAQLIATDEVPEPLRGKRLLTLDLTGMVAGTKY
jgi:ATP-dependent Clp protease ATP-binding subunit ClpC